MIIILYVVEYPLIIFESLLEIYISDELETINLRNTFGGICLTSKLIFLLICDDLIVILSNHGLILLPCVLDCLQSNI